MVVTKEVNARVIEVIANCINIAEKKWNKDIDFPVIKYDAKGTIAGLASYDTWSVHFNPILLMENINKFMETTVPHEIAHLITRVVFKGASAHGKEWKHVMSTIGAVPKRCHDYNMKNSITRRRFAYKCVKGCCTDILLTPNMHNKIQNGVSYSSAKCSGDLILTGVINPVIQEKNSDVKLPRTGTKLKSVYLVMKNHPDLTKDRQYILKYIMDMCDLSPAAAQTYYYKCKKLIEQGM